MNLSNPTSPSCAGQQPQKAGTSKKCKWTSEEDKCLIESVKKHGMTNWSLVATEVNGRTGKQCRERWTNQLCPALNKGDWTPQEDQILIKQQQLHGNTWSKIARYLPGRSLNSVKNRWSWLSRHNVTNALSTITSTSSKPLPKKYFYNPMMYNIPRPQTVNQRAACTLPVAMLQPNSSDQSFDQPNLSDPFYANNLSAMSESTDANSPITPSSSLTGLNEYSQNEELENPLFDLPQVDELDLLDANTGFESMNIGYWDALF